jgi:hypothetical protein
MRVASLLRLLRLGLFALLVAYWAIFIGYTTTRLVSGGPAAVVDWYRHINRPLQWQWGAFLARQIVILALTATLGFFELRTVNRTPES